MKSAEAFSLRGETALITGGATGIGLAMARAMHAAGAKVVLVGRREAELAAAVKGLAEVSKLAQDESGTYRATTTRPESVIPEIYRTADKLALTVTSIYIAETTLEDAFISLVTNGGNRK